MSGKTVGIIDLGRGILLFTTPLPGGSVSTLVLGGLKGGVDLIPGDDCFIVTDAARVTEDRTVQVAAFTWAELYAREVVDDPTMPTIVKGDPRLMLDASAT